MLTARNILRRLARKARSTPENASRRLCVWKRYVQMRLSLRRNLRRIAILRASKRPILAILLTEHLGDIVACEPVARMVRMRYPDHIRVWVTRKPYHELVAHHPALDDSLVVTCLTEALLVGNAVDRVVNLHVNRRRCSWFGTEWQREDGNPIVDITNHLDHGALLECFAKAAGLPDDFRNAQPELFIPEETRSAESILGRRTPYAVLHCLSNETDRNWTTESWLALSSRLSRQSNLLLVEVGLTPELAARDANVIDLCGRLSLLEVAQLIRGAALFIGVESGWAHVANATRCPSLIVMGRYRQWETYMPYTGFLRDHASTMLVQGPGPAATVSVDLCMARLAKIAPDLIRGVQPEHSPQ